MAKHGKKAKSKAKQEFADISMKDIADAYGRIQLLTPSDATTIRHGSNVPLELTAFVGVMATASAFYTFKVRLDATPADGGLPVAITQNATILQPNNVTQFKLTTVHFQPPQGRYHLKASIQAESGSTAPFAIDLKESVYDVI